MYSGRKDAIVHPHLAAQLIEMRVEEQQTRATRRRLARRHPASKRGRS
jgi:hypothetical protein